MIKNKRNRLATVSLIFFMMSINLNMYGQNGNEEIWPEVDGIYRFNKRFRLMTQLSGTKKQSQYTDGSFATYFDFFTFPFIRKMQQHEDSISGHYQWVRIGYSYGRSSANSDDVFKEHMINLESNTRFYLPVQILLTFKNRLDTRVLNKALKERYRPRLTFERDCKTEYLTFTPYLYGEYYFDFDLSTNNRYRFCVGAEIWITKIISCEFYYLKQFEEGTSSAMVNALGTVLKFNLAKKSKNVHPQTIVEERIRTK